MMSWMDCRYFIGDRPCKFKRTCPGCPQYSSMGIRILIIKLAAIGDVLRTTSLLSGLKRTYPQSHITWVVERTSLLILQNNPLIDRIIPFDFFSLLPLEVESFDLIIGLEKDPWGAALVSKLNGKEKRGFGLGPEGNIYPINKASEYAFLMGLDDELKYRQNRKTYPELIYEMVELDYQKDEYILKLSEDNSYLTEQFKDKNKIVIGLNTGSGKGFVNKSWGEESYLQLISELNKNPDIKIILLGGPCEREKNCKLWIKSAMTYFAHRDYTLDEFASVVDACDMVVSGDTVGLHIAIALKKKVVAIFGPSCPQEIELYERGEKVVSSISCAPCSIRNCKITPNCMDAITVDEVIKAIQKLI